MNATVHRNPGCMTYAIICPFGEGDRESSVSVLAPQPAASTAAQMSNLANWIFWNPFNPVRPRAAVWPAAARGLGLLPPDSHHLKNGIHLPKGGSRRKGPRSGLKLVIFGTH